MSYRNPSLLLLAGLILAGCAGPSPEDDPDYAGLVTSVNGPVVVFRDQQELGAGPGMVLRSGDVLVTGEQAEVSLTGRRDAALSS